MKLRLVLAVLALLSPAVLHAQPVPIAREIDLGANGRIVLGEPFDGLQSIAEFRENGLYALRPGTFAGADSIHVALADGVVAAIHFTYAPEPDDFDRYVANGTAAFGPPERWTVQPRTPGSIEYARWQDADTRMELRLDTRPGRVTLTAVMFDRHLTAID